MSDTPGAHNEAVEERPIDKQQLKGVQLYPNQQLVEIRTRAKFAITDNVSVVSWDVIEGLFLTILQMRLASRGLHVGLQQVPPKG
jgi:hypothetical protein